MACTITAEEIKRVKEMILERVKVTAPSSYADTEKDDDFQDYAAYTSVKVFEKMAKDYLNYE